MIEQVQPLPSVDEPPPEEQSNAAAVIEPPKLKADPPPPPAPPNALDQVAATIAATAEAERLDRISEVAAAEKAWRSFVSRMAGEDGEMNPSDTAELIDAAGVMGIEPKDVADVFRRDVEALQTFRAYKAELSELKAELPSLRERAAAARVELKEKIPKFQVEMRREISRMEGVVRRISDLSGFEIERLAKENPRLRLTAE